MKKITELTDNRDNHLDKRVEVEDVLNDIVFYYLIT